jgi:imidazole glycerol-phosphate synthase subunit HisF
VIASGGAGEPGHFVQVLANGGADAALAAGIFHDDVVDIVEIRKAVERAGLPVRAMASIIPHTGGQHV